MSADTRPPLCDWLVENYREKLIETMELTEQTGVEHGFVVIGFPDDLKTTRIISGKSSSIDIAIHTTTAFRPTRVGVHSHPSGAITLSDSDWRYFLTEYAQYGPSAEFPDGWRRGEAVIGKRLGEEDQFGLRALELTEAGVGLSIDEQREWIQDDGFRVINDSLVGTLGSTPDMIEEIGPQIRTCTTTVEMGNPSEPNAGERAGQSQRWSKEVE